MTRLERWSLGIRCLTKGTHGRLLLLEAWLAAVLAPVPVKISRASPAVSWLLLVPLLVGVRELEASGPVVIIASTVAECHALASTVAWDCTIACNTLEIIPKDIS